jgi:polyphosphate kinase 2 (PPK2 family)
VTTLPTRTRNAIVVLLEGRDASGKTTTARDVVEAVPGARVIAVPRPTEEQKRAGDYFRRWLVHLEEMRADIDGEVIIFDRSWYNRALVERVMGFCTPTELVAFFEAVPKVENDLMRRGFSLVKMCLSIGGEEQARRLAGRHDRGELTEVDAEALERRHAYARAEEEMFARTSIPGAEWVVLPESERATRLDAVLACIAAHRRD